MKNKNAIKDNVMSRNFMREKRVRCPLLLILFFSLITSHYSILHAQTHTIDSLSARIKTDRQDTTKANDIRALAVAYLNTGSMYLSQKKYKDAETYTQKCLDIAKSIGDLERIKNAEDNLGDIYASTGEWEKALQARKEYSYMKDSLINEAKSKQIGKLEAKAKYDKDLALQKVEEDKKAALAAAESKRQKALIFFVAAMALAIAFIAFIIARSLRTTRTQKALIEIQTEEVEKQKTVVEEKNQEIMDSINYAKRLQEAILPPLNDIKKFFPDSFIIYKPKDIVSGDFYWLAAPSSPKGGNQAASLPSKGGFKTASSDKTTNLVQSSPLGSGGAVLIPPLEGGEAAGASIFIAAADCTGHGVPGALVSVVCSNALNRAVKEFGITEPGKILDKVRELVLETFPQRGPFGEKSPGDVQDGMDISLLSIAPLLPKGGGKEGDSDKNTNSSESSPLGSGGAVSIPPLEGGEASSLGSGGAAGLVIQWSGAYNPLWYIQNGELKEIIADKQPIGKNDKPKPFTTHTITFPPSGGGGAFYLFTDGYADQFGGPKGKKFKYKQLQEKLLANSDKPMAEQGKILEKTFEKWMGFLEQVDDVLVIGIKV